MTPIEGQLGFITGPIPQHVRRIPVPDTSVAHVSLSGESTYRNRRGAVALVGSPHLGDGSRESEMPNALLEGYLDKGAKILEHMHGPFAVVIADFSDGRLLAAVDRMGIGRMAWGRNDHWICVATDASFVARNLHSHARLNEQALFDFMYSHMVPAPDSAFQNVFKLLPGTAVEFDESGTREFRYWMPDFSRERHTDVESLRERTLPLLRQAVERTAPGRSTGTFLSGGLDSSTITGLFADIQGPQSKAFSVGFGVAEYDEMEYSRIAAKQFDCAHFIYEVTAADIVELIPKIGAAYDEPFGNSSAVPTYFCARLARENGVDHLLGGDGGDELFAGNERYVRQSLFELYYRIPALVRKHLLEPFSNVVDPESGVFPLRKVSSYVRQARIALPERFESWNLIYREGPDRIFARDFLAGIERDHFFRRMNEVWESCPSTDLLDKMLWYDWKYTLADNDLRKVSVMCELAGIRVSYPMLDEDVVAHSIRVPSSEKIKGHELRTFFKNATRGFLPEKIIQKQKHGFGLPFGVWLKEDRPLQDLVYGSLEALRQRRIFADDFLDRVVAEHKEGHASYYGYAIWDLVVLEQWLAQHVH